MDSVKSEAQTVSELCARLNQPVLNVKREGVAVFPNGTVVSLENELLDAKPKRQRAKVNLYEVNSFIDYVKRFKIVATSVIFGKATETGGSMCAIIDYHDAGDAAKANWGEHQCDLTLASTPEWIRWITKNNVSMTQGQFAEFIEDNLQDIINPDGAALLDMVQFMEGTKSVKFKSGKNLRDGAIKFEYSEEITETAGARRDGDMTLPGRMTVRLRPFFGQTGVDIGARLRFNIGDNGGVTFRYVLDRPFNVIEQAFNALTAQVESETGILVMLGHGAVTPPPVIK